MYRGYGHTFSKQHLPPTPPSVFHASTENSVVVPAVSSFRHEQKSMTYLHGNVSSKDARPLLEPRLRHLRPRAAVLPDDGHRRRRTTGLLCRTRGVSVLTMKAMFRAVLLERLQMFQVVRRLPRVVLGAVAEPADLNREGFRGACLGSRQRSVAFKRPGKRASSFFVKSCKCVISWNKIFAFFSTDCTY